MTSTNMSADNPELVVMERRYTLKQVQPTLERLSRADPANVQQIVASQLELMTLYHNEVLDQARKSFRWALVAAGIGLIFFIGAIGFTLFRDSQNAAILSMISGTLIEVISGINFYLYGKASVQFADFQNRLDATQRFLLANSICERLDKDTKQQTRSDLVRVIAGIYGTINMNLGREPDPHTPERSEVDQQVVNSTNQKKGET